MAAKRLKKLYRKLMLEAILCYDEARKLQSEWVVEDNQEKKDLMYLNIRELQQAASERLLLITKLFGGMPKIFGLILRAAFGG